ncbi:glucose 1-dehydrogenase [Streptomyces sp. SRF1]|uniref:SDR family NAD(P)-dependent oxidoreductase n=1 Tax=Streptomyces sp. SRF1 TaxID=1549642 RepID=UPI0025B03F80|nr:glucose 1-dehydrogenase [Streptomyces sp. SRF1]MDN3059001.1 glucose 1-dehydrogenase [Streptomyces sp. SRF1]
MGASLSGKVAVVTGGGRGLGRAFALALGAEGARVVVASRNVADLDGVVEEAAAGGFEAWARPTDVTQESSVDGLLAESVDRFGRVDVMVNNSGVILTRPLADLTLDEWNSIVDTNLRGVFLGCRAAGRHFIERGGGGKVINIASNYALKGYPWHAAYSASKAGVVGLTRSLAVEWARYGIQVNAVAPGYTVTDMSAAAMADQEFNDKILRTIPARRMGRPEEMAPWVVALAGPASDFMTGETVTIDGGQTVF